MVLGWARVTGMCDWEGGGADEWYGGQVMARGTSERYWRQLGDTGGGRWVALGARVYHRGAEEGQVSGT